MRRAGVLAVFMAAFLLAGCAENSSTVDVLNPKGAISPEDTNSKSVFIDDLRLEIATIKETFPRDEIIPLRVSVTNTGGEQTLLTYPTAQKFDFTVQDAAGAEVWRWSSGRVFAQSIDNIKVDPGENYNFFARVDAGFLTPGKYKATGWINADQLAGEKISIDIEVLAEVSNGSSL